MFIIFLQICIEQCTVLKKVNVLSGSASTFTATQLLLKGHFKDTYSKAAPLLLVMTFPFYVRNVYIPQDLLGFIRVCKCVS
jgi:hypothetical protein